MGWMIKGSIPSRGKTFCPSMKHADQLCGPGSIPFYQYWSKAAVAKNLPPPPSSARIKNTYTGCKGTVLPILLNKHHTKNFSHHKFSVQCSLKL